MGIFLECLKHGEGNQYASRSKREAREARVVGGEVREGMGGRSYNTLT